VKLRFTAPDAKVFTCGTSYDCLVHLISRDRPCYYLTSVTKERLPVFQTADVNSVVCQALDEARRSGGFFIYAYVIMLDHFHIVTDSALAPSKTLQFVNGIVSRRLIDYLKDRGYEGSLLKLRTQLGRRVGAIHCGIIIQMRAFCLPRRC
jgi:REP element-mobilizing transposase RayT